MALNLKSLLQFVGTGVMSPTYSYRRKRFLLATSALIVIGTALTYLPGTTFSSDPTRLEDFSYFNDGIGRDTKRRTLRHVGVNHVVDFLAVRHPQIQILEQNQDNNAYYDSARERRDGEGDDVYDDDVDEKEVNARRLELRSRNRSIKEPIIAAQGQILSSAGVPIVNDYIYWSQEVMDLVPKGLCLKLFNILKFITAYATISFIMSKYVRCHTTATV